MTCLTHEPATRKVYVMDVGKKYWQRSGVYSVTECVQCGQELNITCPKWTDWKYTEPTFTK